MSKITSIHLLLALLAGTFSIMASANDDAAAMVAGEIIFSAPPREAPWAGREQYDPIAKYLTQVLGRKVTYKHPGNWTIFRIQMLKGNYDLIFDDGHLNSYRAEKLDHTILARTSTNSRYAVIVKKGKKQYRQLSNLTGRTICSQAPPDLATVMVTNKFKNPSRQPLIVTTEGWSNIYEKVKAGTCEAGILPLAALDRLEKIQQATKVVFLTRALPNLAFSAGPRLSQRQQIKISHALVAKEALIPTARLRDALLVGNGFVPASNKEYAGLSRYLDDQIGYH